MIECMDTDMDVNESPMSLTLSFYSVDPIIHWCDHKSSMFSINAATACLQRRGPHESISKRSSRR
jgi:hypothetical protein